MELQLIDRSTLDLTPMSPKIINQIGDTSGKVKAEIFRSMLEINTAVCHDAHEVRQDLTASIDLLEKICGPLNVAIASVGTHPTAHHSERIVFPQQRYHEMIDRNQWIARRLVIFGVHFHIGMRDGHHAIKMNNALSHYLPLLLALSSSSPYWAGEDTELASSRITFFEALPTGGHACRLTSWEQYVSLYAKLIKSESIRSLKDIWWDIRLSPGYGTVEIRICDGLATLEELIAMTALIHALSLHLDAQLAQGVLFDPPSDWIMRENKWRASRWALDANLITTEDGAIEPIRNLISDLLWDLKPITDRLDYDQEMQLLTRIMNHGASFERQRLVAAKNNGDLKKVTEFLIEEFSRRKPLWQII